MHVVSIDYVCVKLFEFACKKESRAGFPFAEALISCEIFSNALIKQKFGSAVFLAWPTQTQAALCGRKRVCVYSHFDFANAGWEEFEKTIHRMCVCNMHIHVCMHACACICMHLHVLSLCLCVCPVKICGTQKYVTCVCVCVYIYT